MILGLALIPSKSFQEAVDLTVKDMINSIHELNHM